MTGAQRTEWENLLRDVQPPGVRTRLVDLLSAAPAAGAAYDVAFIQGIANLDDVEATIESIDGFRVGDVKRFMQTYRTIVTAPALDNQAHLTTALVVAMDASAARGDSAAQRSAQLDKTVRNAMDDADDKEGNSYFCYALLRLRVDSSKLGKVASYGTELDDADHVFTEKGVEISTSEWQKHLSTRRAWWTYTKQLKANCKEYKRFGLILRITDFNDMLDEIGDWTMCVLYIEEYMIEYRGRLKVAHCPKTYMKVWRMHYATAPGTLALPSGRGGSESATPRGILKHQASQPSAVSRAVGFTDGGATGGALTEAAVDGISAAAALPETGASFVQDVPRRGSGGADATVWRDTVPSTEDWASWGRRMEENVRRLTVLTAELMAPSQPAAALLGEPEKPSKSQLKREKAEKAKAKKA